MFLDEQDELYLEAKKRNVTLFSSVVTKKKKGERRCW
jgi:hypothetical protein